MRALIIAAQGVQDQELVYPYYRLQEAGYEVTLANDEGEGEFRGIQGVKFIANAFLDDEAEVVEDYPVLVLPGGVKAMERLRLNESALHIIQTLHRSGRVVASICSGAQLLISADLVRGRVISAYPAMRVDVENAGAIFHEGPVCTSERIVTAPHYKHLGPWMAAVLAAAAS